MAETSIDLSDLFEQTFKYKTSAFEPEFRPVTGDGDKSSGRKNVGSHGSAYYAADATGREYFMPVTLAWPDDDGANIKQADAGSSPAVIKKWELPYPIISISSKKTIIETALTERRGTVKELINIQDYEIVIKGFIVANTHEFPEADVTMLRQVYEQNVAVSIQCPLTDIFLLRPDRNGSDKVVITELSFPEVRGIKNVRPYELHMVSDESFNLITIA